MKIALQPCNISVPRVQTHISIHPIELRSYLESAVNVQYRRNVGLREPRSGRRTHILPRGAVEPWDMYIQILQLFDIIGRHEPGLIAWGVGPSTLLRAVSALVLQSLMQHFRN
jgi:hypothetical protein